jgi:hypothetical protein
MPSVDAAAQPLPITDHEREIAMLAPAALSPPGRRKAFCLSADGGGTRLSTFAKLGIELRERLIHLVNGTRSGM